MLRCCCDYYYNYYYFVEVVVVVIDVLYKSVSEKYNIHKIYSPAIPMIILT